MTVTHSGSVWYGDNDNNTITGDDTAEVMYGYSGDDTLKGQGGNDVLTGGLGSDKLFGGDGNDRLVDLGDSVDGTGQRLHQRRDRRHWTAWLRERLPIAPRACRSAPDRPIASTKIMEF